MPDAPSVPTRLLAVDVGNTCTSFGLFGPGSEEPLARFEATTPSRITADEARRQAEDVLAALAADADIASGRAGTILSCVVPSLVGPWTLGLERASGIRPLVVGPGLRSGMRLAYKDPAEIGSDRLADAVAARARYGAPVVVVDFGTTLNIEAIGADGSFLGGIIAPGLALGARALREAAARLPEIELVAPAHAIGTSTREAMQSGLVLGELARVDGLVDAVAAELGQEAALVVTGDHASLMQPLMRREAVVDANLTLRGLSLLYAANPKLHGRPARS